MRGKIRDEALDRLSALTTMSTSPTLAAAPAPALAHGAGRPKNSEPTVALQLRVPETMLAALLRRAGEASLAERRHITPQTVVLRILSAALEEGSTGNA
jgi:hypothetical protein